MKTRQIVPAVALLVVAVVFASCGSSREVHVYGAPPPPPPASFSLVVTAGPGYPITRYRDGRYYYRSPQGYMYWRGNDNRYYLDRRYMNRRYYNHPQYNSWKRYHGHYYRGR